MDLNFGIAFFFGVISFFSPCVLPLVPGYLAIFSLNKNDQISRIIGSLQFVLGFSFVFVSLGALATTLGSFFSRNATILSQVSGFIIIFFGLILLIPKLNTRYFYGSNLLNIDKFNKSKNLLMGFTFGFGFTPCIGPVLGALLTLSSKAETINSGIFYLIMFSLGMGIPFLSIAILSNRINLKNRFFVNFQKFSSKFSGVVLIGIGFLIYTDKMYILASFFQEILYSANQDLINTISEISLKFSGKDAFSFVDSLISNSISESETKFSYLLGPDGKVMFWFICSLNNQEFQMYQSSEVLEKMMEVFNKYKIRIDCDIEISKDVSNFKVQIDGDKLIVIPSDKLEENNSWDMLGLSLELPLKNIIDNGILPNEVNWLENFVDYFKGCFMGQEQTSRVKYRGRPRRILKTLPNSTQEIVKI